MVAGRDDHSKIEIKNNLSKMFSGNITAKCVPFSLLVYVSASEEVHCKYSPPRIGWLNESRQSQEFSQDRLSLVPKSEKLMKIRRNYSKFRQFDLNI